MTCTNNITIRKLVSVHTHFRKDIAVTQKETECRWPQTRRWLGNAYNTIIKGHSQHYDWKIKMERNNIGKWEAYNDIVSMEMSPILHRFGNVPSHGDGCDWVSFSWKGVVVWLTRVTGHWGWPAFWWPLTNAVNTLLASPIAEYDSIFSSGRSTGSIGDSP